MNDYQYEEVKHEIYPKGKHLKSWEVIEEYSFQFVPEVKYRINEQKDYTKIRIEERERCHQIYLDSVKRKSI